MALRPGDRFAGFTVERELGAGGMGEVYLARHPRLPRRVALKLLRSDLVADQAFVQRFQREAETVAGLDHPAIVPIDDSGAEQGRFWFSMRYIDGITADEALRSAPYRLDPARAVRIIERTASALDFAHRRNLVHRDVKPANILLSTGTDDDPEQVFLSDFGVAKGFGELEARAPSLTATGGVVATVDYAAPEQIEAKPLDGRCDVYALGCVLFKLLTGRIPFPGESLVAKVHARMSGPTPRPSTLYPELVAFDQVIARALERDRDRRFQTCRELSLAARAALDAPAEVDLSTTTNLGTAGPLRGVGLHPPARPAPSTTGPPPGSPHSGPVRGPFDRGQPQGRVGPSGRPGQAPSSASNPGRPGVRAPSGPPQQPGPPAPSWPQGGWQAGGNTPPPGSVTPLPPPREGPMPTSINSLLGGQPVADRRRSVRNRSLLAVGLVILVAGALVGTLILTGGFSGSTAGGPGSTTPVSGPGSSGPATSAPVTSAPSTSGPTTSEPAPPTSDLPQAAEALRGTALVISAPANGGYATFAIDASSGESVALTTVGTDPTAPVLSPDRRTVLWVEGDEMMAVGADGTGRTTAFSLPDDCTATSRPSWNFSNPQEIALSCIGSAGPRLVVLDLTGALVRDLPIADLRVVDDVEVSPDGTRVMFRGTWSDGFDPDKIGVLWSVPMDGTGQPTQMVVDATDGVWSPDNSRIAYRQLSDGGESSAIVVSNLDGSDAQQYSADGVSVRAAYFSRDGAQLAWTEVVGDARVLKVAEVADPSSARVVGAGFSVFGPLTW